MSRASNPIVETYSRLAAEYDDEKNLESCWGRAALKAMGHLELKDSYRVVVDVGCGTGGALAQLAVSSRPRVTFIGIDPAANMRRRARARTRGKKNVRIVDGSFEHIPLESGSADYLYSIMAFHWTTDLDQSVEELARVLRRDGEMDLVFIGRWNGREFIKKTTPIFLKHMGLPSLLESATMRKQLSLEEALTLFGRRFRQPELSIEESYETYYDTLEGHWGWWVRIEGQFLKLPPGRRGTCDREVRTALAELATERGIPYTIHALHVRLRRRAVT